MNLNEMMSDEQYQFCKKQANFIAKILMEKDVKDIFGEGNATFIMETLVILVAGTLSILKKHVNVDPIDMLSAFCSQAEFTIKAHEKKPFLTLVQ